MTEYISDTLTVIEVTTQYTNDDEFEAFLNKELNIDKTTTLQKVYHGTKKHESKCVDHTFWVYSPSSKLQNKWDTHLPVSTYCNNHTKRDGNTFTCLGHTNQADFISAQKEWKKNGWSEEWSGILQKPINNDNTPLPTLTFLDNNSIQENVLAHTITNPDSIKKGEIDNELWIDLACLIRTPKSFPYRIEDGFMCIIYNYTEQTPVDDTVLYNLRLALRAVGHKITKIEEHYLEKKVTIQHTKQSYSTPELNKREFYTTITKEETELMIKLWRKYISDVLERKGYQKKPIFRK